MSPNAARGAGRWMRRWPHPPVRPGKIPVVMCIDGLLCRPGPAYLALVVRSDGALYPEPRSNLECTLRHLLSHAVVSRLVFETPAEMIRRWR